MAKKVRSKKTENDDVPKISATNLAAKMKLKEAEFKKSQKNSKKDSKKASTKTKSSSNNKSQHRIDKESAGIQDFDEGDRLLKEVLELGGSKEDLALIDNADSDSEQSELELGSKSVDSGLDADVESFIAGLGLDVNDTLPKTPCERPKETNKRKDDDHDKNKSTQAKEDLNKSRHKDPEDFASKSKAGTRDRSKPNGTTAEGDSSSRATKIKFSEDGEGTIAVSHSLLILEPRTAWYDPELEPPVAPKGELSPRTIEELHEQAKALLNKENDLYVHENAKSGSQKQFLSQLLSAGTLSDKISALTLLIQESPLHSVRYFETMLGLCKKKSKGSALQGVAALKDVFVGGVLPDRKLKWFKNQPLSTEIPASWLIIWAFEDWLKHFFFSLLQILETLSHDPVVFIRSNSLMHIVDLLRARPEQEVNLLRLAVNKLGDLDRKVASRASHLLLGLQEAHPAMKGIIVNAISEVVFRNNADYHTRYYSMITLNQVILAHKDGVVANSLIKIYLSLFERLLAEWDKEKDQVVMETKHKSRKKKAKGKHGGARQESKTAQDIKEEQAAKLTASILTGLNRAYPFSDLPKDVFDKHVNTLYRVTHSANFNTAVQALILIYQISKDQSLLSDRFYRTLYESLLDSRLANSSKLRLYLNLVFKSLREDVNVDRVRAFAKRMVQVADHWLNIGVVSAVVFLISEIGKQMPKILSLLKDSGSQDGVEYDGRHRDPQYAKANESVRLWELLPLVNHFHPTAALYAEGLLTGDSSALIKPDITLHTLTHFLDRFVYRNPRQTTKTKGGSIMQPLAGYDPTSIVDTKTLAQVPANSADWASMKPDRVAPDERFFYHYFVNKQAPKEKAKKAKGGRPDEDGEFNEDDIWNALVNSRPDVEGEDSDVDSLSMTDMSDFDEENGADIDDDELVAEDDEKVVVESGDEESDVAEESSDQGDVLEMDDLEDEDGMLSSDEELPSDELESDSAMEENQKSSGKRSKSDKRPSKRLKLKDLPVFGDMNDYAKYLDSEDEDYS